jgi:23S rRNA (uracil1939-C5)-methyltransferase
MLNLDDEIELKIEKMANEGKGLGRHDNQVIFVPLSAPGDTLTVKITKKNKNFCEAEILEIKSSESFWMRDMRTRY